MPPRDMTSCGVAGLSEVIEKVKARDDVLLSVTTSKPSPVKSRMRNESAGASGALSAVPADVPVASEVTIG